MSSKDNSTKKTKKRKRNPFRVLFYDFVKFTGAPSVLIWLRPKKLYESKAAKKRIRKGAIVAANHTGFSDPLALLCALWYRRPHMIALKEMFESKTSMRFFCAMGCIPVDRQNFNMQTYRASVDVLSKKKILCVFPEGAINQDSSTIQTFKSGAALMALKGGVPIIPVYIAPRKKWYTRSVTVFGEPIDVKGLCGEKPDLRAIDRVTEILHEKEMKLMEIYNAWNNKRSSK